MRPPRFLSQTFQTLETFPELRETRTDFPLSRLQRFFETHSDFFRAGPGDGHGYEAGDPAAAPGSK